MTDIKLVPIFKVHKIPYRYKKLEVLEFKEMVFGITVGSQLFTTSQKYSFADLMNKKNSKNMIVWLDDSSINNKIKECQTYDLNDIIKYYNNKYKNNYWTYDGNLNSINNRYY